MVVDVVTTADAVTAVVANRRRKALWQYTYHQWDYRLHKCLIEYHFTDALAEHVSKIMVNANGQQHSWTTSQVKKSMESLGLSISDKVTIGDVTYAANMAYADLYPDPLKDEAACLRYAYKIANDPDGYEGMIFCRWTADAIGKAIKLDWEKFV